jgi:hypothetical protein
MSIGFEVDLEMQFLQDSEGDLPRALQGTFLGKKMGRNLWLT